MAMKAMVYTRYGTPDDLELKEIEKPVPTDDEVLIKVHAVSVNDWDWQLLQGSPFINRLINGLFKPKRRILGSDIAGCVELVGKNVTRFKPGDEVCGDLSGEWGGFAEYVCARENFLADKPAGISFAEAAAIPQAGLLALQGLRDTGHIQPGQKLLINGAGGGVGTFGIQLARLNGVTDVTGVDNAGKLDMMRSMGFNQVIDYTKEDFSKNGIRYDLILDTKTNRSIFSYLRPLNPNGVYATVGGSIFRILLIFILGPLIRLISKKSLKIVPLKQNRDLPYLNELCQEGKLKSVIDGNFELNEIPEAMRYFGSGKHKGKLVITIHDNQETGL